MDRPSHQDVNSREKQILLTLSARASVSELGKLITELFMIRLDKYKDKLVKAEDPVMRGRAQELRDILSALKNGG